MEVIMQFGWPLFFSLCAGFIIGVVFGLIFGEKIGIMKKILKSGTIMITLIGSLILFGGIAIYFNDLTQRLFVHKIVVVKDIDLEKDYYLSKDKNTLKGTIKAGTLATQTFSKGQARYINFSTVVDEKFVKMSPEEI